MSDLERFIAWCVDKGHYMVPPLADNFRLFETAMKERESEALREWVEKE